MRHKYWALGKGIVMAVGVLAIALGLYFGVSRIYRDYRDFDAMRSWVIRHALAEQAAQKASGATLSAPATAAPAPSH